MKQEFNTNLNLLISELKLVEFIVFNRLTVAYSLTLTSLTKVIFNHLDSFK